AIAVIHHCRNASALRQSPALLQPGLGLQQTGYKLAFRAVLPGPQPASSCPQRAGGAEQVPRSCSPAAQNQLLFHKAQRCASDGQCQVAVGVPSQNSSTIESSTIAKS